MKFEVQGQLSDDILVHITCDTEADYQRALSLLGHTPVPQPTDAFDEIVEELDAEAERFQPGCQQSDCDDLTAPPVAAKPVFDDVTAAVNRLVNKHGFAVAKDTLESQFGITKVSQLPEEQWASFISFVDHQG